MRKDRRYFSEAEKQQAVAEYTSGRKTVTEIAQELGIAPGLIYKWKVWVDERAKGHRIDELEDSGHSAASARKIQELEAELAEYQKKVGEQAVMIDLLKKHRLQPSSVSGSALSGLIATINKSAAKRKRAR